MRTTMTGVFRDPEAALRASERLRELEGAAGSIRLFLPGADGRPVETLVVEERSPWLRATVWGLAVGLFSRTSPARCRLVALLGGGAGRRRALRPAARRLARRRALSARGAARTCARATSISSARGAPSCSSTSSAAGADVRELMEESGAYVSEGYWPVRDRMQPV